MSNRTKYTPKKVKEFIDALRESGGNVSRACDLVAIHRRTAYEWRESDEDFARLWDEAVEAGTDDLEQEARRRALDGLRRKKFTKTGVPIIDPMTGEQYEELEYSDTLLIFLMKGNRPDKYKDRSDVNLNANLSMVNLLQEAAKFKDEQKKSQN